METLSEASLIFKRVIVSVIVEFFLSYVRLAPSLITTFPFSHSLCQELAKWLIEKEMIEHLFGPNHHIEVKIFFCTTFNALF